MKCPNCGAETKSGKYCEYCGSELPNSKLNINITNNYYSSKDIDNQPNSSNVGKCPNCGSTRISFQREQVHSVKNIHSQNSVFSNRKNHNSIKEITYRTVGLCQNCGYTWTRDKDRGSGKGCGWWFLMLLIWPFALSVWFYKTDKIRLEKKWKLAILTIFWIIMLIVGTVSQDKENASNAPVQNSRSMGIYMEVSPGQASPVRENPFLLQNASL